MKNKLKQIAIYGKGGIGKSTIACNLAVALQEKGRHVLQIGCSPKIDSTAYLLGGEIAENAILHQMRKAGKNEATVMSCVNQGYRGIYALEAGGPVPGEGCAGMGASNALSLLQEYNIYEKLGVDFVIYDVLGDVVCGGFAQPIRGGNAEMVYLVTSGELMSLYSANNICISIADMHTQSKVRVGGLINNMRGVDRERELVDEFARQIGVPVLAYLPRSMLFWEAEGKGGTVLEHFPDSEFAGQFRYLADAVLNEDQGHLPTPITLEEIKNIFRRFNIHG